MLFLEVVGYKSVSESKQEPLNFISLLIYRSNI